jgi:uncharacterized protein with FMN-binding domain
VCALVASCATTGGLTYVFASSQASQAQTSAALPAPVTTAATTVTAAAAPTTPTPAAPTPTTPMTTAAASTGVAAFDGSTVSTRYGPVQVQAQIEGGKLVAVAVEQFPDSDRKSQRINASALPQLQTEALAAQSAQVDTVSGATYTSDGYATSLQSALDQARASGALA